MEQKADDGLFGLSVFLYTYLQLYPAWLNLLIAEMVRWDTIHMPLYISFLSGELNETGGYNGDT